MMRMKKCMLFFTLYVSDMHYIGRRGSFQQPQAPLTSRTYNEIESRLVELFMAQLSPSKFPQGNRKFTKYSCDHN